jgi:uncharacterized repeat protein (TIGR01451 family)
MVRCERLTTPTGLQTDQEAGVMTQFQGTHSRRGLANRRLFALAAALFFAGVPRPLAAATFNVPAGDVQALIQAIEAANATPEADTINLAGGTYTLTVPYSTFLGLPGIDTPITIEGHGAIIERSSVSGTPDFRIFVALDPEGQLTLNDMTVRNGRVASSTLRGGGIFNLDGTVTLTRVTVSGNSAANGGGIWSNGTLRITRSTISGNSSIGVDSGDGGGGVYNAGTLTISESTISGNDASLRGGGIYSTQEFSIAESTLSDNEAGRAGGIYVAAGQGHLTNSTVSRNSAGVTGGGIFIAAATLTVTNSSLVGNSAASSSPSLNSGGGIFAMLGSSITLTNSIVANSPFGGNCFVGGSSILNGNNLATDNTCPGFAQVSSGQLNLGPLFPNGGPTWTHALLTGSLAIDAGDQAECLAHDIVADQRGFARDSHCDIGAFEFNAGPRADLLISQTVDKVSVRQGDTLTYFITVKNLGPDTAPNVIVTDTMSSGTTFLSVRANKGTFTAPPAGNTGTVTWYLGDALNTSSETAQLAVTVLVKGKTTITNTAQVSADVVDPNTANNSAAITVSVAAGSTGSGKGK